MFVGGLPSELDGFRTFVTFVTFQQLWLRPIDPGSIIGHRNEFPNVFVIKSTSRCDGLQRPRWPWFGEAWTYMYQDFLLLPLPA
jgi:hypothetical protein